MDNRGTRNRCPAREPPHTPDITRRRPPGVILSCGMSPAACARSASGARTDRPRSRPSTGRYRDCVRHENGQTGPTRSHARRRQSQSGPRQGPAPPDAPRPDVLQAHAAVPGAVAQPRCVSAGQRIRRHEPKRKRREKLHATNRHRHIGQGRGRQGARQLRQRAAPARQDGSGGAGLPPAIRVVRPAAASERRGASPRSRPGLGGTVSAHGRVRHGSTRTRAGPASNSPISHASAKPAR